MDAAAQYALAYALTTSAGLRAILPLALVSIAAHAGYLHPPAPFGWLGSTAVMVVLLLAAAMELTADKVPIVDHALHVVQIVTKPAAAAILVGGAVHAQNHDVLVGLMVLGALNALGVHAIAASVRVGSTATTAGLANPFVSVLEDGATAGTSVLALFAPFLGAALAFVLVLAVALIVRAAYRRTRVQVR